MNMLAATVVESDGGSVRIAAEGIEPLTLKVDGGMRPKGSHVPV
jgi:hypothetical protein